MPLSGLASFAWRTANAFVSLVQLQATALVVDADAFLLSRRGQLVALASRYAVPVIYARRQFVAAGGLMSYGIDDAAVSRQAGVSAGRILNGAKPSDLPVQQPTTFREGESIGASDSCRARDILIKKRSGKIGSLVPRPARRYARSRLLRRIGIINLAARSMLVVSVTRRLGSERPLLAYLPRGWKSSQPLAAYVCRARRLVVSVGGFLAQHIAGPVGTATG